MWLLVCCHNPNIGKLELLCFHSGARSKHQNASTCLYHLAELPSENASMLRAIIFHLCVLSTLYSWGSFTLKHSRLPMGGVLVAADSLWSLILSCYIGSHSVTIWFNKPRQSWILWRQVLQRLRINVLLARRWWLNGHCKEGGRRNSLTILYSILRLHYAGPEPTATEIARPLD